MRVADATTVRAGEVMVYAPDCLPGIGAIIGSPNSEALIEGVRIAPCTVWPDDRGYFMEVIRAGQGLAAHFPPSTTQVSATFSYPGTIKAFHFHKRQYDCWMPVAGMLQVALVDLRPDSPTYGVKNTLYVGALRPWQVLIPPGVGHGYKAIGRDPALLVYVTSRFYDVTDEGRIPHDDARLNYDWTVQHK
jgi:dTDP-4-dehydrorhamnose 3,5-epimerase